MLCVSKGRFKSLKKDFLDFPFEKEKSLKKEKYKKPSIEKRQNTLPFKELTIDDDLYSSCSYTPDNIERIQGSHSWRWIRAKEWFELMDAYDNPKITEKGGSFEKLRTMP